MKKSFLTMILASFLVLFNPLTVSTAFSANAEVITQINRGIYGSVQIITEIPLDQVQDATDEKTPKDDRPADRQVSVTSGSGFFISNELIITNAHVISDKNMKFIEGTEVSIMAYDNQKLYKAAVVGIAPLSDIALLRLVDLDTFKKENPKVAPLRISNTPLQIGESIYVIGSPWGRWTFSVTEGIVSSPLRTLAFEPGSFTQIDANIYHGNSGGPVINEAGDVVGVSVLIMSDGNPSDPTRISFIISAETLRKTIADLTMYGEVKYAVFGITFEPAEDGIHFRVVRINDTTTGFEVGDEIQSINDVEINEVVDIKSILASLPTEAAVSVVVVRDGEPIRLRIVPKYLTDNEWIGMMKTAN